MEAKKITIPPGRQMLVQKLKAENFEWHLEPNAHLVLIHIQEEQDCMPFTTKIHFELSEKSSLTYHPILLGAVKSELHICVQLHMHASAIVAGAYALNGKQQCSLITHQEHLGKSSTSSLTMNGIAADQAIVNYKGVISIQKNAVSCVARQENKTVLLGKGAQAFSVPSLEVHTNDVQCAHGSAVGPLQENQLLYARSRGISEYDARRLLITSLFAQTLQSILDEKLRNALIAQLVSKVLTGKEY